MDAKLKHQIGKLVKAASGVEEGGSHKPRPGALVAHDGDKAGNSDGSDDDGEGVYKPLKRTAVLFEEGGAAGKAAREEARRKARASKSKLFADLLGMYTEAPEEVAGGHGDTEAVDDALKKRDEDRRRFEEDNFVRLTVPRGEKSLRKKRERERSRVDPLKDLTSGFAEIEALAGGGGREAEDSDDGGVYDAAARTAAKKKKARSEAQLAKAAAASRAATEAPSEEDIEGERRASKDIMKNRGLTKYRNKERKYAHFCLLYLSACWHCLCAWLCTTRCVRIGCCAGTPARTSV